MIILFASPDTLVAKLLSKPAFVGIGLVSYSAYLWHQPILAFVKMRALDELHPIIIIVVIALTFGLAYLTYRFVERPFRRGGVSSKGLLVWMITALVVCNGLAWAIIHKDGFPKRLNAVYSVESRTHEAALIQTFTNDTKGDLPVVLIVGDSYVTRWSIGLSSLIDPAKYRIVSVSYLGCNVAAREEGGFDVELLLSGYAAYCTPFDTLLNDPSVMENVEHVFWASHRPFSYASNLFRFDFINALMQQLSSARLHVIGGYHQMKYPENPSCLNAMFVKKRDASVCLEMSVYPVQGESLTDQPFFDRLSVEHDYFDPIALLCGDDECPFDADGVPFIEDWNHLTVAFLVKYLPEALRSNASYFEKSGLSDVLVSTE